MLANNAKLLFLSQFSDAEKLEIEKLAPEVSQRLSAEASVEIRGRSECCVKLKEHGLYWVYVVEEDTICHMGTGIFRHSLVVFNQDSEHARLFENQR